MASILETVLTEITAWQRRTGTSDNALGLTAVNDPAFMSRLRSGSMTVSRLDRVRDFIAQNPNGVNK